MNPYRACGPFPPLPIRCEIASGFPFRTAPIGIFRSRALVGEVARTLRMSEREDLNFTDILRHMRYELAVRYLHDRKLRVSKIAWLLGFKDVSAFSHAFKRWTGKTPSQLRCRPSMS
jgi:hypothetical protein